MLLSHLLCLFQFLLCGLLVRLDLCLSSLRCLRRSFCLFRLHLLLLLGSGGSCFLLMSSCLGSGSLDSQLCNSLLLLKLLLSGRLGSTLSLIGLDLRLSSSSFRFLLGRFLGGFLSALSLSLL